MGFKLVEVPFPYTVDVDDLKKEAEKYNLKHVLINAPPGNFEAGDRGLAAKILISHANDRFNQSLNTAIKYAKALSSPRIHVMAGIVKQYERSTYDIYVKNIRIAAEKFAKEGIECLIEPINNHTIPGYFLRNLGQAAQVLDEVKSPNLKILYDVFHIQQIHGQLSWTISEYASKIGHIQVAQVPKRTEPDTEGEIDYTYIFKLLKQNNPDWIIGCEYINSGEMKEFVEWVHKYGLEF
uniref:Putative hydroxypyruvate isomerase n=1 Tax=Acrobeloides nanus TaxID=290746 RepID=A0A914DPW2_9BILA